MAQILQFTGAAGHETAQRKAVHLRVVRSDLPANETDVFWLHASRGHWSTKPEPVNPENSQGRVLSEMVTVLTGACLLVLLSIVFVGAPYP
jgi:hypothetical protein